MAKKVTVYATHATLAELLFRGDKDKQVVIKNIDATSDKGAAVIKIYGKTTGPYVLDDAAASGQKVIPLASTTGLTSGDIVVIRSKTDMSLYEKQIIDSVSAGISITIVTNNLTNSYAVGDVVFEVFTLLASIKCGAASINRGNGNPVIAGVDESPIHIELDGTSACDISATAEHEKA